MNITLDDAASVFLPERNPATTAAAEEQELHYLDKLHHHIKDQLPKPNDGLIDAYKEIIPALIKQREDTSYSIKKDIPQLQNV